MSPLSGILVRGGTGRRYQRGGLLRLLHPGTRPQDPVRRGARPPGEPLAGEMYAGGGMWMAEKPRLDALRRSIVETPDRVREAIEEPAFVAWFGGVRTHDSLKRIPAGYPPDHPMADMFRWKDVIFGRRLSDAEVCSPGLPDLLAEGYAAALPVFRYLATLR